MKFAHLANRSVTNIHSRHTTYVRRSCQRICNLVRIDSRWIVLSGGTPRSSQSFARRGFIYVALDIHAEIRWKLYAQTIRSADLIRIRIARIGYTPAHNGVYQGWRVGNGATLLMYVYRGSPPRNMIQHRSRRGLGDGFVGCDSVQKYHKLRQKVTIGSKRERGRNTAGAMC